MLRNGLTSALARAASAAAPTCLPRPRAAQPRWVSKICPTFIRDGTPNGFSTISTGVPSSRYGISSIGTMREITPLFPWRPAILSPGCNLRFTATKTLTIFITPGSNSSPPCNLSTLSLKRACNAATALSKSATWASISFCTSSALTASCCHCDFGNSSSMAASILLPALIPFGPVATI